MWDKARGHGIIHAGHLRDTRISNNAWHFQNRVCDTAGVAKDGDTTASQFGMALSLKWPRLSVFRSSGRDLTDYSTFSSLGDQRERSIQPSGLQPIALIE